MSESFAERLSRLTPEGSGIDRDALIFAAGKASVRRGRLWPALAGTLAACQVLTLALPWPRGPAPIRPTMAERPDEIVPDRWTVKVTPDEAALSALDRQLMNLEENPDSMPAESLTPDEPPLRAIDSHGFGAPVDPAGFSY
jgi:hypothetical protein